MKKTNKTTVNTIVVDFTDCTSPTDGYKKIAIAKFDNMRNVEKAIIKTAIVSQWFDECVREINGAFADALVTGAFADVEGGSEKNEKKPNVFKRFWNWITRKK